MDSARYKAFLAAVESGSFTKAAEKLNYTPSGVCQLVNALEKEIGFSLLYRDKKGVKLTAGGEALLPAMHDLLHQEERLIQMASELNGLAAGRITIGAYSSIATHWLPPVIKGFQAAYPKIEIHLREGIRQENERWLEDRVVDLAFVSHKRPMDYHWIPLQADPMIAVLPRDHPLAREKAYPLENCPHERFIMPALGRDDDVMELLKRNHLRLNIVFSTLENFTTMAMIEQGMGMSIMNALITKSWICDVAKLPLDPPQSIVLGIAVPSLEGASPAARRFIDYAVQQLKRVPFS